MRRRAAADVVARRINAAVALLADGLDGLAAARRLARRQRLSERQARRYVEQARAGGPVRVPSPKVVFTVKLPADIVRRLHRQARRHGLTLSAVVEQALQRVLDRWERKQAEGSGAGPVGGH
jgi:hypothetical protein